MSPAAREVLRELVWRGGVALPLLFNEEVEDFRKSGVETRRPDPKDDVVLVGIGD
jgi:hypothetical protein